MCFNSVSEGCLRMRQEASLPGRSAYDLFCNRRWECSSCRGSFVSTGLCPELRQYSQLKYVPQQWFSFTAYLHSSSEVSKSIFQLRGASSQANAAGLILHCPAACAVSSACEKRWQDLVPWFMRILHTFCTVLSRGRHKSDAWLHQPRSRKRLAQYFTGRSTRVRNIILILHLQISNQTLR